MNPIDKEKEVQEAIAKLTVRHNEEFEDLVDKYEREIRIHGGIVR